MGYSPALWRDFTNTTFLAMREVEDEVRFQPSTVSDIIPASKIFSALSFHHVGLRTVVLQNFSGSLDDNVLDLLARGALGLEELEITQSASSTFSEVGIRHVIQSCKSLHLLVIREAPITSSFPPQRWTLALLRDIATHCPQLRSLGLVNLRVWIFGVVSAENVCEEPTAAIEALRHLFARCQQLAAGNLFGTISRTTERNPSSRRGVFHALHAAVAAAPAALRIQLAADRLPVPLRVFCGDCRRCRPSPASPSREAERGGRPEAHYRNPCAPPSLINHSPVREGEVQDGEARGASRLAQHPLTCLQS